MHRRTVLVAALAAAVVALSSCSDEGPTDPTGARPDPRLTGTVLAVRGNETGAPQLVAVRLPSGAEQRFRMPKGVDFTLDAAWGEDGRVAYTLSRSGTEARLYRVSTEGPPEALGPPVEDALGSTSYAPGRFLVATCGRGDEIESDERIAAQAEILVLDLDRPTRYRKVGTGCVGALSPDGEQVVYAPNETTVFVAAADGSGRPEKLLSTTSIEGLVGGTPRMVGNLEWGAGGIAVRVKTGRADGIVVVGPGGEPTVTNITPNGLILASSLTWQPDGELLGFANTRPGFTSSLGMTRVLDSKTGDLRVVSVVPPPLSSVVWSPDGEVLLSADDREAWTFSDAAGNWIDRIASPRAIPLGWTS